MSAAVVLLLIGVILMVVSALLDLPVPSVPSGLSSCLYKLAWACFLLWLLLGMGKLVIGG